MSTRFVLFYEWSNFFQGCTIKRIPNSGHPNNILSFVEKLIIANSSALFVESFSFSVCIKKRSRTRVPNPT
jgi:hypothetical protein